MFKVVSFFSVEPQTSVGVYNRMVSAYERLRLLYSEALSGWQPLSQMAPFCLGTQEMACLQEAKKLLPEAGGIAQLLAPKVRGGTACSADLELLSRFEGPLGALHQRLSVRIQRIQELNLNMAALPTQKKEAEQQFYNLIRGYRDRGKWQWLRSKLNRAFHRLPEPIQDIDPVIAQYSREFPILFSMVVRLLYSRKTVQARLARFDHLERSVFQLGKKGVPRITLRPEDFAPVAVVLRLVDPSNWGKISWNFMVRDSQTVLAEAEKKTLKFEVLQKQHGPAFPKVVRVAQDLGLLTQWKAHADAELRKFPQGSFKVYSLFRSRWSQLHQLLQRPWNGLGLLKGKTLADLLAEKEQAITAISDAERVQFGQRFPLAHSLRLFVETHPLFMLGSGGFEQVMAGMDRISAYRNIVLPHSDIDLGKAITGSVLSVGFDGFSWVTSGSPLVIGSQAISRLFTYHTDTLARIAHVDSMTVVRHLPWVGGLARLGCTFGMGGWRFPLPSLAGFGAVEVLNQVETGLVNRLFGDHQPLKRLGVLYMAHQILAPRVHQQVFTRVYQWGLSTDVEVLGRTTVTREDALDRLGLSSDASDADIKHRYRQLMLKFHPDKNSGLAPEEAQRLAQQFYAVQEAYDGLIS